MVHGGLADAGGPDEHNVRPVVRRARPARGGDLVVGVSCPSQTVAMVLRLTALLRCHAMGIVEADQPLASRPVQGQRVVDAVRLLW